MFLTKFYLGLRIKNQIIISRQLIKSIAIEQSDTNMMKYSIGFNQILLRQTFVGYSSILMRSPLFQLSINYWMNSIPCNPIPCIECYIKANSLMDIFLII